jgi:hypothetical protein
MKRLLVITLVVLLAFTAFSCKKKSAAAAAKPEVLLAMLPQGAMGVASFDVHSFSTLSLFDNMIKDFGKNSKGEKQTFKDYPDFVARTGIDIKRDVYAFTAAWYGGEGQATSSFLGVVTMNYDKAKLLALMNETKSLGGEETYQGVSIYKGKDDEMKNKMPGAPMPSEVYVCFLDNAHVLFGSLDRVKSGIDLSQGKGQSLFADNTFKPYLEKANKTAMAWLVSQVPASARQKPADSAANSPFKFDFSSVEAVLGEYAYTNHSHNLVLQAVSMNAENNKQLENTLLSLKGFGAMMIPQDMPELGELLNAIQITSGKDNIKMTILCSDALTDKLVNLAKNKAGNMMKNMVAPSAAPDQQPADTQQPPVK